MNLIRTLLVDYLVQNRRLIGSPARPQRSPSPLRHFSHRPSPVVFFLIMGEQSIKLATLQA